MRFQTKGVREKLHLCSKKINETKTEKLKQGKEIDGHKGDSTKKHKIERLGKL